MGMLGEAYLTAGRFDEAHERAQQALDRAREQEERPSEAWALLLLGRIAADRNPPELIPAERSYTLAMDLAEKLGMRPVVAHCHAGLGRLHQRVGSGRDAEAEFATAIEMFREMDMRFWLERAEAERRGGTP
jgi:tetratricopeptide (TPR) repeat protein